MIQKPTHPLCPTVNTRSRRMIVPCLVQLAVFAWPVPAETAEPTEKASRPSEPFIEHVVRDIEGWQVHVDVALLEGEGRELGDLALRLLADKLHVIALMVPDTRVKDLREVPIWLDLDHPLTNMQYHPDVCWLVKHGYDPKMRKSVHIPRAQRLVSHIQANSQPWVVLHELAHAYHDRVLGFDHAAIEAEYDRVVRQELYGSVLHVGGRSRRHYALTNPKEYFAEMTEAYFGMNDFYPFVRVELARHDPDTLALMKRIWHGEPVSGTDEK